ncbi:MAG: hypothetical protein MUF83_08490 [Acidimicrobiales bacterium]|jgi:hypothetical protein|nr:hypothetical protein [Acidimicrobiales bacterium]
MDVTLTDDEVALLRDVLTSAASDLRMEIADTDNPEYKRGLHERQARMSEVLTKLGGPVTG